MKNFILLFLSIILLSGFSSCNKTEDQEVRSPKDPADGYNNKNKDASAFENDQKNGEESEQENDRNSDRDSESENKFNTRSITVKFPTGSTQITLDGNINGFGEKISYEFEASKGQTLNAFVKPKDGEGNIRINQIIFPDGKADGPFGDKMTYKLTESGNWKLILGEDMMAGEPWKGTYLLTIEIK